MTLVLSLLLSLGAVCRRMEAWAIALPVYEGGRISKSLYLDGSGIKSDGDGPTGSESLMELVRGTNESQYENYCKTLEEAGCRTVYKNALGGVTCAAFRRGEKLYYTGVN